MGVKKLLAKIAKDVFLYRHTFHARIFVFVPVSSANVSTINENSFWTKCLRLSIIVFIRMSVYTHVYAIINSEDEGFMPAYKYPRAEGTVVGPRKFISICT